MRREKLQKFWCGNNVNKAAEFFKDNYSLSEKELIEQANLVCDNTFVFREHWEMERTNQPVTFNGNVEWDCIPSGDPEWTFALNRHTCFVNLAKAWNCTKNEKYAEKFMELAKDWMERVPLTEESKQNTWRSIEAGIRCENWLKSMMLFADCGQIPESFWDEFERILFLHGEYLMSVNGVFHRLSNWGILQNHGLLLAGIYFENNDWIKEAVKRLEEELYVQIFEDGTQWEQSPMYHGEVLHCSIDSIEHMKRFGIQIPAQMSKKVENMLYALAMWCKPNGNIPCQSDSDDIDAGDLLVHGACFYNDGILKFLSDTRFREENIWNLGIEDYLLYEKIEALAPKETSYALADSGNYMLRSGFDKDADYLRFHNGCMGSGHGHGDLLHIDLFSHGEDILIDTGRYTYVDSKIRRDFKSPSAHNTICVDDEEFSVCANSWGYEKMAQPIKGEYRFTEMADFVSGAHLGYIEKGIFLSRKVVYIKPSIYVIMDECYGSGTHRYMQNWHFSGDGNIIPDEKQVTFEGKKGNAKFFFLHGQIALSKKEWSAEYNSLKPCNHVSVSMEETGSTSMITVISTGEKGDNQDVIVEEIPVSLEKSGKILTDKQAEAIRIKINEEEYVVVFLHEEIISEVDLIFAGGYSSYGKVLLFSNKNPRGICLQY
ncbi:alginate lyase family protein [Lachnoclostridium phytofermentans]|uniref:Heparinase II/III family protein n=1 Tax=Lachnoclostridium phytofermentans (strain ATCC 700394 / DSM 18823 / ISDg) TaxID=357809 RepID=A9KQ67_LACP7|nr:alginate lyase family protein [Lachnoclostridium phytofermentans]ABX43379.1 Heparinase II/III family protein [Lachnoclostridium phytofermentans ISDg]